MVAEKSQSVTVGRTAKMFHSWPLGCEVEACFHDTTKEGGDTAWIKGRNNLQGPNPSDQLPPSKPYFPNSQQPSKKFYSLGTKHIKHEIMGELLDSIHNMCVKKLADTIKKKSPHLSQCVSPSLLISCATECKILSYNSSPTASHRDDNGQTLWNCKQAFD